MTLSLRCPVWVAPGALAVYVNGHPVPVSARPGSFVNVSRLWKTGDRVEMTLPMRLTTEPLPNSSQYAAFFYGPVPAPEVYARRMAQAIQESRDEQTLMAHALGSDRSHTGGAGEPYTHWRDAKWSFGYALKVPADKPAALRCVYWGRDAGRTFDILVDGTRIATRTLTGARPGKYLPVAYPVPPALTRGKEAVTVRFQPAPGQTAGGVFDVRVVL